MFDKDVSRLSVQARLWMIARIGLFLTGLSFSSVADAQSTIGHIKPSIKTIAMPQGAFLKTPCADVSHLVQQVQASRSIALRYARLFHLPVTMVPLAFQQLHLKKLDRDHTMQVHYVKAAGKNETEHLVFKYRRVAAGTPVFCLPDGTPLLARICGNPLRSRVENVTELTGKKSTAPSFISRGLAPGDAAAPATAGIATARGFALSTSVPNLELTLQPAVDVLAPESLPRAPALSAPALRAASLPPVYAWAHNRFAGAAGLALLPSLLPMLFGGGGPGVPQGGSSGSPSLPASPTTPGIPSSPSLPGTPSPALPPPGDFSNVPEPGAMMVGGTALLSLFALARGFLLRKP